MIRWAIVLLVVAIGATGPGARVAVGSPPSTDPATSAPPSTDPVEEDGGSISDIDEVPPVVTLPIIPVPIGCTAPAHPLVVFLGTVVARDDRTARFRIDDIRAGATYPFGATNDDGEEEIDVRYGLDVQYLVTGEQYLVGAVVDPDLGYLVSRTSEPNPNFGGDEVIGVSETDVACPDYEDPMTTLHPDGTPVEGSMLKPFFDAKVRIIAAFLVPFGLVVAAIFVLASMRLSVEGAYRSVTKQQQRPVR
jgi:hypothetical protein